MFSSALETLQIYQTTKVVQLKDRHLSHLYYGLIALILTFVIGYEILYCNDHFEKRDVTGTALLNIQHPTLNACNPHDPACLSDFTPQVELPYCTAFTGQSDYPATQRRPCIYADKHTLVPTADGGGSLFVPTRIETRSEVRNCHPTPSNNFTCGNEFTVTNVSQVDFVADIERYTVLVAHSYSRDAVRGNNNALLGSYLLCEHKKDSNKFMESISRTIFGSQECEAGFTKKPINCIVEGGCIKEKKARKQSLAQRGLRHLIAGADGHLVQPVRKRSALPQVLGLDGPALPVNQEAYAIPDGDVFTLGMLLRLASVSLDKTDNLDDDESLRDSGTVLDIQVFYNNLHHFTSTFGNTEVEYWYKVAVRPLNQVKNEVVQWTSEDGDRRTIESRHGIDIVVTVQGTFGFFSLINLLLMLTTASALLAVATVVTDKIALSVMHNREMYAQKKYEVAEIADSDEDKGPMKA